MAQPEYGAKYCNGAASDAVADTIIVYFIASILKFQIQILNIEIVDLLISNTNQRLLIFLQVGQLWISFDQWQRRHSTISSFRLGLR
jgi:hypothetical protein